MFNYAQLDGIVSQFLQNNIEFTVNDYGERVGTKDLVVYITGLSCAQASVIKMCQFYKVNLTFMHHDIESRDYIPQVIWKEFSKNAVNSLFPASSSVTMYNCNYSDIDNNEFFYINVVNFCSKNKNMRDTDTIVCANEGDVRDQFGEMVKLIMSQVGKTKKSIFVYKASIKNKMIINSTLMNQINNFKVGKM